MTSRGRPLGAILPLEVFTTFRVLREDMLGHEVRDAYMRNLRDAGWTFKAIGTASGLTGAHAMRIVANTKARPELDFPTPIPPLPKPRAVHEPHPRIVVKPSSSTLAELLRLQDSAQRVRGHGLKHRKDAEEYTSLVNYAHTVEGVTLYTLAKCLGVTHGALRFRLVRYGYRPLGQIATENAAVRGTINGAYRPILQKNRVAS